MHTSRIKETSMQFFITTFIAFSIFTACGSTAKVENPTSLKDQVNLDDYNKAYFASGCFWCVEAIFESVKGVPEVISGYAGGNTDNPTYREVGSGRTGHAEVIEVYYDPAVVSFKTLVDVYYASQDPTTVGQSPDFGSAYRSIIFYQNEEEKAIAEAAKMAIGTQYKDPVVTEIMPFERFYKAEDYHQDYERLNPRQSYIVNVSIPRLKRFQAKMPQVLKAEH